MAHWAPGNVDLPASGVTAATYGDSTHVGQVAVDAAGRITSASNVAISASSGVSSLDSITGAVSLVAGSNVTITDNSPGAGQITIASSGGGGGSELDYVEVTSTLTLTATTAATGQVAVQGVGIALDGSTDIKVEFFCPFGDASGGVALVVDLWDGATDIARIGGLGIVSGGNNGDSLYCAEFLRGARRPSNATHTYAVKAWKTGGTAHLNAGAGAGADVTAPMWYRVTKV